MASTHAWVSLSLASRRAAAQALVLAGEPLGVDEEAEALVEGQARQLGGVLLLGPRLGHGLELEGLELLDGGFAEHG